jgi:hypothetical protein
MNSIRDFIKIADAYGTEARNLATSTVNEDLAQDLESLGIDSSIAAGLEDAAKGNVGGDTETSDGDELETLQQELEAKAKAAEEAAKAEEDAAQKAAAEKAARAAEEAARAAEEAAQTMTQNGNAETEVDDVIQRIKDLSTDQILTTQTTVEPEAEPEKPEEEPEFGAGDTSQGPADDVAAGIASGGVSPKEVPADNTADPDATDPRGDQTNPPAADPDATDPRGDQTNPPAADPDATDPRGDQTNPPAPPQTDAEEPTTGPDDGTRAGQEPNAAPAQGDALAGRLDTTTPSLLDAYNDGGRRAMDSVRDLQTGLSRLGFDPNGIDGKYGRGTYAAVQDFQKKHGLTVDGEAGPATMKKMQELLNGSQQPEPEAEPEVGTVAGDDKAFNQGAIPNTSQDTVAGDDKAFNQGAIPNTSQDTVAGSDKQAQADADGGMGTQPGQKQSAATQAQRDAMAKNTWDPTKADGGTGKMATAQASSLSNPQPKGPLTTFANWKQKIEAIPGYKLTRSGKAVVDQSGSTVASINDRGNPFFGSSKIRDIVRGPQPTAAQKAAAEKRQGEENWNAVKGMWNRLTGKRDTPAPVSDRNPPQGKQPEMASKDYTMKNVITESIDECGAMPTSMPQKEGSPVSMNVTLNASGEEHVQDLIRMMQLAGASGAGKVADMHVGPKDSHDDMAQLMAIASAEQDEGMEEDWDNSPNEDYKDHEYMTKDLSGGINRQKKAYAKAQDGDNAMAVESIKEQLLKALEETGYKK